MVFSMNMMTAEERKELGHRIKLMRGKKGITQRELAEKIGYKLNTVAKFEQGERVPNLGTMRQIADALSCKVAHFVPPALLDDEDKDNISVLENAAARHYVDWLRAMMVSCATPSYEDVDLTHKWKNAVLITKDGMTYDIEKQLDKIMEMSRDHFILLVKQFGEPMSEG